MARSDLYQMKVGTVKARPDLGAGMAGGMGGSGAVRNEP